MKGKIINSNLVLICFLVACTATMGSLFFSEVMQFVPCSMCWYQRIFMYPLVLIFLVTLLYPDENLFKYAFPIVLVGFFFAFYHNLLMWDIIPETVVPCVQGVPCSTQYLDWGFITIPFLSLLAYSIILITLLVGRKKAINSEK